jgi:hypothetical protein
MQGYLFAHPGPPEAIEELLRPEPARPEVAGGDLQRLYSAIDAVSCEAVELRVEAPVTV